MWCYLDRDPRLEARWIRQASDGTEGGAGKDAFSILKYPRRLQAEDDQLDVGAKSHPASGGSMTDSTGKVQGTQ